MGATARSSTLYTNYDTNKYTPDARDRHGRVVPYYFEFTVISASNIGDTYNLFTLPANWSVMLLHFVTNAIGASAGAGATVQIGDSGDDDRYAAATDVDVLNQQFCGVAYAGVGYRPTADTIIVAKNATAAWVKDKLCKGHFLLIPPS